MDLIGSYSAQADAIGSRLQIFILPIVYVIISEVMIFLAKRRRKHDKTVALPLMIGNEWRYVGGLAFIGIVFILIMFEQVGIDL